MHEGDVTVWLLGALGISINIIGYIVTITLFIAKIGNRIELLKQNQDQHAKNTSTELTSLKADIKQIDATEKLLAIATERIANQGQLIAGLQQSLASLQRDVQNLRVLKGMIIEAPEGQ